MLFGTSASRRAELSLITGTNSTHDLLISEEISNSTAQKMHIVIAHYSQDNLQEVLQTWTKILNMDKVSTLLLIYIFSCHIILLRGLFHPRFLCCTLLAPLQEHCCHGSISASKVDAG